MVLKGFKFGMLLQLAVGPVCILVFQIAVICGFTMALTAVLGVAIIDCLYIIAAILGIASLIKRTKIEYILKFFGVAVLVVFGVSTVLGVFNISFLPSLNLKTITTINSAFITAVLVTLSNPLTIIFWAGVFSMKVNETKMKPKEMYLFGLGAVLATISFLTLIALGGSITKTFFSIM